MSHLYTNKEDIEDLVLLIDSIPNTKLDKETLNYILLYLFHNNKPNGIEIDYRIYDNTPLGGAYVPKIKKIIFSLGLLNNWIDFNTSDISTLFNVKDIDTLRKYMTLYPLIHEGEHFYQHMMGLGKINAPNAKICYGYKYLFNFISNTNLDIITKLKRYKTIPIYNKNKDDYVLERNANYETTTLLTELALYRKDIEIAEAFRNLTYSLIYNSYKKDILGPMYHTFKDLKMLEEYNKIKDNKKLNMINNIRYGLEITEEERLMLLKN